MARWAYVPTVRPARGFCGSVVPFRRKGEYQLKGRRLIPLAMVSALWKQGLSASAIAARVGEVRGARFTPCSVSSFINSARLAGQWDMFPLRRPPFDDESDIGADDETIRALGL